MNTFWLLVLSVLAWGAAPGSVPQETPPLVLCCAGDSLMRPMPSLFRRRLSSLSPSFLIEEWAQGGLSSATYQGFYRQQAARWRRVTPDFILLQLGTNDAAPLLEGRYSAKDFQTNLTAIIQEFLAYRNPTGKTPFILVATIPFFSDIPANRDKNRLVKDIINPAIRRVAANMKVLVIDNFSVLEGKPELYDPDGVHPNSLGETALVENWIKAIKGCLEKKG